MEPLNKSTTSSFWWRYNGPFTDGFPVAILRPSHFKTCIFWIELWPFCGHARHPGLDCRSIQVAKWCQSPFCVFFMCSSRNPSSGGKSRCWGMSLSAFRAGEKARLDQMLFAALIRSVVSPFPRYIFCLAGFVFFVRNRRKKEKPREGCSCRPVPP